MEVHLTPDQKAFAREAVQSERLARGEDALKEALLMWRLRSPVAKAASSDQPRT